MLFSKKLLNFHRVPSPKIYHSIIFLSSVIVYSCDLDIVSQPTHNQVDCTPSLLQSHQNRSFCSGQQEVQNRISIPHIPPHKLCLGGFPNIFRSGRIPNTQGLFLEESQSYPKEQELTHKRREEQGKEQTAIRKTFC